MNARVSQLALTGFRGATKPLVLQLDPSKPVVVIHGENGTGKSTIVDAIDFVTNGGIGMLAGRQSTPAKEYLPALGAAAGTLAVELTIGADTWRATLAGGKPSLAPSLNPRPQAHVLRRGQILDLLAATPGGRYQQLARFVAVPGVETAEEALRSAVKDTRKELDDATAAIEKAQRQIAAYWVTEGKSGPEAIAWARDLASRDAEVLAKAASEAGQLLDHLARAVVERDRVKGALQALGEAAKQTSEARERLRSAEHETLAAEASLMELLEQAEHYVSAHPALESCPVCEQPIGGEALLESLKRRRAAGAAVDQARGAVDAAARLELGSRKALEAAQTDCWRAGGRLLGAARASRLKTVTGLGIDWAMYARLGEPPQAESFDAATREAAALVAAIDTVSSTLRSASQRASDDLVRMRAAKELVKSLDESSITAKEAEQLLARLIQAQAITEARRKAFVDGVLADISARVSVLYAKIHPGEEIGDIKLATDPNPKKRASLDLKGRFNEVCDIPPEGYYSESHLDTLGICVFLALAERSSVPGRPNLLVLDDVLTSVDAPHLDRFVSLVHDEAEKFSQVVLTTHYRHWFETYRRKTGPAGPACLIELSPWSIENGIRTGSPTLAVGSRVAPGAG